MARSTLKNVLRLLDTENDTKPVHEEFLTDLKRSIELDDIKSSRKPSQAYKPSSMNCIRNMYYQMIGVEPDKSDTSYTLVGICNSGTDIHERVQKYVTGMRDNGMDCEYVNVADYVTSRNLDYLQIVSQQGMETKLYHKDLKMSFLCDGIIRYKGHYYILELKTENSRKWLERDNVDPKHYAQGTAYSIAFGIKDVVFVYISRDVLDMKSYMFTPTEEMKLELVNKIETCEEFVNTKTVPPMPDNAGSKLCAYCNYKKYCQHS